MSTDVEITVNDQPHALPADCTVAALLARLALAPQRVAVEVNQRLVRRALYGDTRLNPGDRVEIVTLVGGG